MIEAFGLWEKLEEGCVPQAKDASDADIVLKIRRA
jgi:hypothetical protein